MKNTKIIKKGLSVKLLTGVELMLLTGSVAQAAPVKPAAQSARAAEVLANEPKLARKYRVHCEGMAVGELLARLSQQAGVELTADSSVADDKVIVFSPPRPLQATLTDLAALFNAAWQPFEQTAGQTSGQNSGKAAGKVTARRGYRLTRSRAAQEAERRLVAALPRRIEAGLDVYVRALDTPAAQIALRDRDDLIRVYAEGASGRLAGSIYRWLRPAQRATFLTHRHLTAPFDSLPPDMKQGLRVEYAQHIEDNKKRREKDPDDYPYPVGKVEDLEGSVLRFDLSLLHGGYLPRIAFGQGASLMFGRVDARDTYMTRPHGDPYADTSVLRDAARSAAPPALPLPASALSTGVSLSASRLQKAAQQPTWTDRLKQLAEATGAPILADTYRSQPVVLEAPLAYEPLASPSDANKPFDLDAFCRPAGTLWWTRGKTLLFRKRDWYDQRRYETPDRWILETIRQVEAHDDYPTFADVFRLRELTFEQMMGLCGDSDIVQQYDIFDYSGASEFLTLLQSEIINPNARLPEAGVVRPDEEMAVAWPLNALSARQKRLLDAFQQELHYDLPGSHSKIFRAEIGYGGLPKNRERFNYRYHRLVLTAKYDHDQTYHSARLSLPATLIDDRRDQTTIELVR